MSKRHIASVSWGKDSLCMLLMLIEKELPLDEVVFYDTGMEFQSIYDTRDAVLPMGYSRSTIKKHMPKRPIASIRNSFTCWGMVRNHRSS